MKRDKILYIDDEANNLQAFRAALRRDFEILLAEDVRTAEALLQEYADIKVLIVDQGLPEITGLEYLESIEKTHPEPMRIILTGQADVQLMIDAINRINLFRFILKPWNNEDLRQSIKNAIQVYDQRRHIRAQEKEMRKAYERLNRLVYSASHEMRSPITTAKGLLSLAKTNERDPEQLLYLDKLTQTIDTMDEFVSNLIMFHQHSNQDQQSEALNPEVVTEECLEQLPVSHQHQLKFELKNDLVVDSCMLDIGRLKMILINLLSNAFKFRREGEDVHRVGLSFQREQTMLLIEVSDSGPGIPEGHITHIFDMFNRGSSKGSGTGMGLFIVKEITDALGGNIEVKSNSDIGTKFTIRIPVKWLNDGQ